MPETLAPRQREGDAPSHDGRSPPQNPSQDVLFHMHGRYVVVNKPADVRMDGDFPHTVESLIRAAIKVDKAGGLRFVQRLDYATSGVLLAALSRPAAAVAGAQFETRTVTKKYLALLHGSPAAAGAWSWRIAEESPEGFHMRAVDAEGKEGRAAHTEFRVLRRGVYKGAAVALVELTPRSGRRHQLRVHSATAGFPIVGDATYAGDEFRFFGDEFEPPRMMLHALELSVKLPESEVPLRKWKPALKMSRPMKFSAPSSFEELEGLEMAHAEADQADVCGHPGDGVVQSCSMPK